MYFIDFEKAFDSVKHDQLMKDLHSVGADGKYLKIITYLHWRQSACIKLRCGKLAEDFEIKKEVRQGFILSSMLFNLYVEWVFLEALQDLEIGIKVNGRVANSIRHVVDMNYPKCG